MFIKKIVCLVAPFLLGSSSFAVIADLPKPPSHNYLWIQPKPDWVVMPEDNPDASAEIPIPYPDVIDITYMPSIVLFVATNPGDYSKESEKVSGWQLEDCEIVRTQHVQQGTYITIVFQKIPTDARASLHWIAPIGSNKSGRFDVGFRVMLMSEYESIKAYFPNPESTEDIPYDVRQKAYNTGTPVVDAIPYPESKEQQITVYAMPPINFGKSQNVAYKPPLPQAKRSPHWKYPPIPDCTELTNAIDHGWKTVGEPTTETKVITPYQFTVSAEASGEIGRILAGGKLVIGGQFQYTINLIAFISSRKMVGYKDYYILKQNPNGSCSWKFIGTERCTCTWVTIQIKFLDLTATGFAEILKICKRYNVPLPDPISDPQGFAVPPFDSTKDCTYSSAS